ncbi:MAG TPA: outer membrane lipoprotein-sorting protein [Spirochaetia bacterium]|nr:outer membrane lipoprotein-sorting protein [Spirochaetia bacterium]
MKKSIFIVSVVALCLAATTVPVVAQEKTLSPTQILDKVDDAINGPKDQSYSVHLVLIDKDGGQKTREMIMLQKGRDRRLVRFTAPADQRGIAFLSLPGDVQYLYLPAFNKVRRIATSVKNTNFAGTDFTYDDLEAVKWSEKWSASIKSQDQDTTILELTPKRGRSTDYSRQLVTVRNDSFYPVRVEIYDRSGTLAKVLTRSDLKQVKGYWVSMDSTMEDLRKQHKTQMIVSDLKLDTGIGDDRFTERYLSQ